jgi:hypothetical protein
LENGKKELFLSRLTHLSRRALALKRPSITCMKIPRFVSSQELMKKIMFILKIMETKTVALLSGKKVANKIFMSPTGVEQEV